MILFGFSNCRLTKKYHYSGYSVARLNPVAPKIVVKTTRKSDRNLEPKRNIATTRVHSRVPIETTVSSDIVGLKYGSGNAGALSSYQNSFNPNVSESYLSLFNSQFENKEIRQRKEHAEQSMADKTGLFLNSTKPKVVNYVDTSDPEVWAILFFCLGLAAGVVALVLQTKLWVGLSFLFLLLGVLSAVMCQGDYYYMFTKAMMVISSLILIIWGGMNASLLGL